ncbi:MAG TPA: DUF1194 domain-containing protein [Thermohalobaculum sp.]|nr:DUF1194 domain-containing protein [Thermohalobaculum sp.]
MRLVLALIAALALVAEALVPRAHGQTVDLELVLLADASRSIDDAEIRFQRQGHARAITDPAVLDAIAHAGTGRIAIAYVEWGDRSSQDLVAGWSVIDGRAAAEAFAEALLAAPRRARGANAIGAALLGAKRLIEQNRFEGMRRVIDFSADSANNFNGPPIAAARDEVLAAGIVINGLAVLCHDCPTGRPVGYDLERAFAKTIIGGPGSFVLTADGPESFAAAVRRKLILEIAGAAPVVAAAE